MLRKKPLTINNVEIKKDVIILESYTHDRKTFFVNRENFQVHTSLPMTDDNTVCGETMQEILSSMKDYFTQKETELNRIGTVIIKLSVAFEPDKKIEK